MVEVLQQTSTAVTVCALVAFSAISFQLYLRSQARGCPPGPKGDPILGNLRYMPDFHPHLYYTELKEKYGDLVFIQALTKKILLLGSYDVANQLMSKRGVNYSERPFLPLSDRTLALEPHPPISPYGPKWKEERRLFATHMGKEAVQSSYRIDVETEAQQYVLSAMENKKNMSSDYFLTLLKTFIHTIYGVKIHSDEDELLRAAVAGTSIGSSTVIPGRFWVNLVPALMYVPEWFPGAGWKRVGKIWKGRVHHMIETPFERARNAEKEGTLKQSFILSMLRDETFLSEFQIMHTGGSTFIAGTETTGGTVMHFIYAMLLHPEIQKKAQEEIDRVVGRDRLPTVDDHPNLPYIEAIYKETLRWRPVAPFGIPHEVAKTDEYQGYVIPQGTMIVQNTWAFARDEAVYPECDKFKPERFMINNPPLDPRLFAFGVGRRVCPGQAYGEAVVLAAMLTMLSTMDIVKAVDEQGNEIPVDPGTTGKLTNMPLPFQFVFRPRSDAALALLRDSVAAA